jgi:hypothetical protein
MIAAEEQWRVVLPENPTSAEEMQTRSRTANALGDTGWVMKRHNRGAREARRGKKPYGGGQKKSR